MAKDSLAKYDRHSVIQPSTTAGNISGAFNRVSQAMVGFSNLMGQFGERIATERAQEEGELAGRDPNFEPSRSITGPDKVFRDAAIRTNRMVLSTDIKENIDRLHLEVLEPGKFNVKSIDTFNSLSQGYAEGVLGGVPEFNKGFAQDLLRAEITQAQNNIQQKVYDLNKNELSGKFLASRDKTNRSIGANAFAGNLEQAAQERDISKINAQNALDAGFITPEQYRSSIEEADREFIENKDLGGYSRAAEEGPEAEQKYLDDFDKRNDGYTGLEKMTMKRKFLEVRNNINIARGLAGAELSDLKKNTLDAIYGGATQDSLQGAIDRIRSADGRNFESFKRDIQEALFIGSNVNLGKFATPGERAKILSEVKQGDPSDANDAGMKARAYEKIARAFDQMDKAMTEDPAGYMQQSPQYKAELQRAQEKAPGADPDGVSVRLQRFLGVPANKISVLGNAQAAEMVNKLSELPLGDRVAQIDSILSAHPKHRSTALKDLRKAGMPYANELISMVASNPLTRGEAGVVAQAYSVDLKVLKDSVNLSDKESKNLEGDIFKQLKSFTESLKSSNTDISSIISDNYDAIYRIALFKTQRGQSAKSSVKDAANIVIKNQYEFYDYRGGTIRAPKGVPKTPVVDGAQSLISEVEKAELMTPAGFYSDRFKGEAEEAYKTDILDNGKVVTRGDNRGLMLIDAYGNPVFRKDGSKMEVDFSQLINPEVQ